ncbi:hypothetical protein BLNAU_20481 [Blattamonas nauphoetae]|uniref:Uncharacterized protein n=1 Tax=Blattamonas nauphoetae TaxID=2049346 RepID=A0ABQ9X105_9EUKA|nr:hypothetical protein BLNAU_20481 [Blattamonas nauphoetae]
MGGTNCVAPQHTVTVNNKATEVPFEVSFVFDTSETSSHTEYIWIEEGMATQTLTTQPSLPQLCRLPQARCDSGGTGQGHRGNRHVVVPLCPLLLHFQRTELQLAREEWEAEMRETAVGRKEKRQQKQEDRDSWQIDFHTTCLGVSVKKSTGSLQGTMIELFNLDGSYGKGDIFHFWSLRPGGTTVGLTAYNCSTIPTQILFTSCSFTEMMDSEERLPPHVNGGGVIRHMCLSALTITGCTFSQCNTTLGSGGTILSHVSGVTDSSMLLSPIAAHPLVSCSCTATGLARRLSTTSLPSTSVNEVETTIHHCHFKNIERTNGDGAATLDIKTQLPFNLRATDPTKLAVLQIVLYTVGWISFSEVELRDRSEALYISSASVPAVVTTTLAALKPTLPATQGVADLISMDSAWTLNRTSGADLTVLHAGCF